MFLSKYLDKHWKLLVINFENKNIEWDDNVFDQLI